MEDRAMTIVVRFKPTGLTAETYDESTRQLAEAGVERLPEGLDYHVCFGTDGNLQVSEIWDSREHFEAFGERLRLNACADRNRHRVFRATRDLRRSQDREALAWRSKLQGGSVVRR
jgi:hypothetical protein